MIALTGDNEYLIKKRLDQLVSEFEDKNGNFSVERIDSSKIDFDDLISNIQSVSFLSPKRMFVLLQPGKFEEWTNSFSELSKTIPGSTTVIVVEPRLDKRLKYYKDLRLIKRFESYDNLVGSKLGGWVIEYAKNQGSVINFNDANYLISSVGNDQNRLANELDKLVAFNSNVTTQSINLLVEPSLNTSAFQLLDMAFSGQHQKVFRIFDHLMSNKTEIPLIIGALAWQLQLFALIKSLPGYTSKQIADRIGANIYSVENSIRLINNLSYGEIAKFSQKLVDLSIEVMSFQSDQNEVLLNFLNSFYK